jgi:hypothetical protein
VVEHLKLAEFLMAQDSKGIGGREGLCGIENAGVAAEASSVVVDVLT